MRIIHELNQLAMGGAERVVLGIAKNDKKNEHTVFSYKDGPMRQAFEDAGVKVMIEQKEGEAPNLDVDVIHIHTGGSPSAIAAAVRGQIATIETVHSPVISAVRDSWVHARVGVSNVVTKRNRKCRTIYNGIDLSRLETDKEKEFFKEAFNIPKDAFVVGRLGRLGYDKGVEEWLAAAWYFQKDHPNAEKIYFVIAGAESEPGYWAAIKVMCKSLPLQNVRFIDLTDNVMPVYNAMDVFMYPSPTEGFGLVYMEAMACGVPVLAWDTDVTRELLTGHARLVPATVDGLIAGLNFMHDQVDVREELGAIGQELVLSDFTAERMSANYQKLYEEVYRSVYNMEPAELVKS